MASLTQEKGDNDEVIYKNYNLALVLCKSNDYFTILNNYYGYLIQKKDFKELENQYQSNRERTNDLLHNSIYDLMYFYYVKKNLFEINKRYEDLIANYPKEISYINEMLNYFNIIIDKNSYDNTIL